MRKAGMWGAPCLRDEENHLVARGFYGFDGFG